MLTICLNKISLPILVLNSQNMSTWLTVNTLLPIISLHLYSLNLYRLIMTGFPLAKYSFVSCLWSVFERNDFLETND